MISRSKGERRHVSMTVTKKEKPAAESEELPRGTELGITLRSRAAESNRESSKGSARANHGSGPGGLSGHQDLAVFRPPVVARRHRLPRTLVSSMQGN